MFFDITFIPGQYYHTVSEDDYEDVCEILREAGYESVIDAFYYYDNVYYLETSAIEGDLAQELIELGLLGGFTYLKSAESGTPY